MSRSQRALRYRENYDVDFESALQRGERSLRTPLEQRTALLAQGFTTGVPPANTVLPAITGTVQQGQLLTCSTGTWTAQGVPSYAYQWYRGNTPIAAATANTYTPVAADVGYNLFCRVTNTDDYGAASVDAAFTTAVLAL